MCLGGKSPDTQAVTPAAAPAAPAAPPKEANVGSARKAEERKTWGNQGPTTRVDRSIAGGVVGGSGLSM